MAPLSVFLFPALAVVALAFAMRDTFGLPEAVATHFNMSGVADGWMSRENYRLFLFALLVALPAIVIWITAYLPRLTEGRGQIPNNEFWFSPERRVETEKFLVNHGFWLGCFIAAVGYSIHRLIFSANEFIPPSLSMNRLFLMLAFFFAGLIWWAAALLRHFKR